MKRITKSAVRAIALCAAVSAAAATSVSSAQAAAINLFRSAPVADFKMNTGEKRQTLVEVLSPIYILQLGAQIDPVGNENITWSVYQSDGFGSFVGSVLFSQTYNFTDIGASTYNVPVKVTLNPGFFIFEMQNQFDGTRMIRYNERNEFFPFFVDGTIKVFNGGANNFFANTILPAFSVTTAVPIPAALPLMAGTFALFGFAGWRRK